MLRTVKRKASKSLSGVLAGLAGKPSNPQDPALSGHQSDELSEEASSRGDVSTGRQGSRRERVSKAVRLFRMGRRTGDSSSSVEAGDPVDETSVSALPTIHSERVGSEKVPSKIEGFPGVPSTRSSVDEGAADALEHRSSSAQHLSLDVLMAEGSVVDDGPPSLSGVQGSSVDLLQLVDLTQLEDLFAQTAQEAEQLDATEAAARLRELDEAERAERADGVQGMVDEGTSAQSVIESTQAVFLDDENRGRRAPPAAGGREDGSAVTAVGLR